jgi:hypothetical protein
MACPRPVGHSGGVTQLPTPLRAALGLAASVADTVTEAIKDGRGLPPGFTDKVLELPVLAVSTALQLSLRAQQQYLALTVRGDEVLSQLRGVSDDAPEWATFDDDPPSASDAAPETPAPPKAAPRKAPAKKAAAKRAPAKKAPAKRVPATKATKVPGQKPSAFDLVSGDDS